MTKTVYKIFDTETGRYVSVYMGCFSHEQDEFASPDDARNSNCHGIYADAKYRIDKFNVTYQKANP
jgi:hypothetical protein